MRRLPTYDQTEARFIWCGPDDCGYPEKACPRCDETCLKRPYRHVHPSGPEGADIPGYAARLIQLRDRSVVTVLFPTKAQILQDPKARPYRRTKKGKQVAVNWVAINEAILEDRTVRARCSDDPSPRAPVPAATVCLGGARTGS